MKPGTLVLMVTALFCMPAAARAQQSSDTVTVCVITDGNAVELEAQIDSQSGDPTWGDRPLDETYPATSPPYLAGVEWYARDEMVDFQGRRYVRYGTRRVVRPQLLVRVGEFRGVPLYAESAAAALRFVYALVNRRCEFQPYWYAVTVGEVRGG